MKDGSVRSNPAAILTAAGTMSFLLLLAAHADMAANLLRSRITLCLETLIPSLFGCMALANLLTDTGAAAWLGMRLRRTAKLLRIPHAVLTVFLVSQIAGYPVGTLLLRRLTEQQQIQTDTAARYAPICFGGGPAFLVGLAGVQLFGSAAAGWVMLAGCICANLLLLILMRQHSVPASAEEAPAVRITAQSVTDAVSGAMRSLAGICGMVMLFALLLMLCDLLGIFTVLTRIGSLIGIPVQTSLAMIAAVSDVTQLEAVFHCGIPFRVLIALTAALLSFGGFCVHMQCLALGNGILRLRRLLGIRLIAAAAAFLITYAFAGFLKVPDCVPVFAVQAALSKTGSPLPALMIFFTGFPFLIKKD